MAERKLSTAGHSLYESLGLAKGASPEEIKKAYRLLALRNHPDKNPDDPTAADRIRQINYANGILSDPQKRQLYDAYGSLGLQMAEQVGEERMRMMSGPWFKACFIFCGIISGCYCCFCCCCCCKLCREKRPMEGDLHMEEQGGKDSTPRGFDHQQSSPRTEQPGSNG
ncbi:hypothetical protein RvY_02537-2 [Ramazzottius varieornatus]|uniref:J domain-containing protein n=1 Tax=Ramazzottius varieornatus TaxID=947166 RepID=A0A1D1UK14_RAMVA|nr:hypothetical protein RvY_02537-2 [Ramazzottius varieornatus]